MLWVSRGSKIHPAVMEGKLWELAAHSQSGNAPSSIKQQIRSKPPWNKRIQQKKKNKALLMEYTALQEEREVLRQGETQEGACALLQGLGRGSGAKMLQ